MTQSKISRRLAMLDAAGADAITDDENPTASAAVVHTAAWALMDVGDETLTDIDVTHLHETMRTSGVNATAHVWSCSPEFILPDALWCAYLLYEWCHRDPLLAVEHYVKSSCVSVIQGLEAPIEPRPLSLITEEVDPLLHGNLTDDNLEHVLGEASYAMRALTVGEAGALRIRDPADSLTHRVTICHSALLVTADEFDVTMREAAVGTLG